MAATAPRLVDTLEGQGKIRKEDLLRILVIDDEDFRVSMGDALKYQGYKVDTATNPEDAERLLAENSYQVVIADINFPSPSKSGDQFIIENQGLMLSARKVAVTGQGIEQIKRRRELEEMEVTILEKDDADEIEQITEEKLAERRTEVNAQLEQSVSAIARNAPSPTAALFATAADLQNALVQYLRTRANANNKTIFYGGVRYSTNDIAREIEEGTKVGEAHVQMMTKLFKKHFRLD